MNLCHFVRVLTVWGPMRLVFKGRQSDCADSWKDEALILWPIIGLLLAVGLAGVGLLVYAAYSSFSIFVAALLSIAAAFGIVVGVIWIEEHKIEEWTEATRIYRDYRAAKTSKICPLVTVD